MHPFEYLSRQTVGLKRSRRRSPPLDSGKQEDRYRKNAQSDDDHPLDRTVMLIGIPPRDSLNPVREERCDDSPVTEAKTIMRRQDESDRTRALRRRLLGGDSRSLAGER